MTLMTKAAALLMAISSMGFISHAQTIPFSSSDLPIVVINTNGQSIPDDPKITADMGVIFNGVGLRNNITDSFNNYNGKIGIEVRGQSSQMFPMKSYSLELQDASGNSVDNSILGMPKESDWVMYAPYTDKTLMRNFLAYTMAREMGQWAARCRYVEVVLNGDYVGVYVFMEKIKRNGNRVNVTKMGAGDISGDALTGGYIFSLDKEATGWFSSYPPPNAPSASEQFDYVFPKPENIVPEQKNYIKSYVDSFENALAGPQYQHPVNGVRRFADLPSFIDFFIVNAVSRNVDAYRLSSFFHKDRNSKNPKIIAGPVWDYDLAFRNADYCSGSSIEGWAYGFNYVCPGDYWQVPFWWDRLMTDTAFEGSLRCRWKELRQSSLRDTRMNQLIDSVNGLVAEAQQRHFQRWPILGQYVWPNPAPIPTSYAGEISQLKSWVSARLKWIDDNIPNMGPCRDWPQNQNGTMIVKIYPNPVSGRGAISLDSKNDQVIEIQVTDAVGRIMTIYQANARGGTNTYELDMKGWGAGIYFLRFMGAGGETVLKKVMKL